MPKAQWPTFCLVRFACARRSFLFCVPDIFLYLCLLCGSMCSLGSSGSSKATLQCYTSIFDVFGTIHAMIHHIRDQVLKTITCWRGSEARIDGCLASTQVFQPLCHQVPLQSAWGCQNCGQMHKFRCKKKQNVHLSRPVVLLGSERRRLPSTQGFH